MDYFTLLTNLGAQKIAAATAANTTIDLTEIAIGDGSGTVPIPNITQAELVNEVFRTALSELKVDENNTNQIIARAVIPASEGNFWVREVGIFDADGDLIAVGNYPETYKSILAQGAAKEIDLRVVFEVANTEVVQLVIDPSIVMASQEYVDAKATGFKNLIINGCKRVNQKGASSLTQVTNAYNYDRWYYDGTSIIQYVEALNVVVSGEYTLSWIGSATAKVNNVAVVNGGQVTLAANTQVEIKFNNTSFALVQLEFGSKKTNFESRSFALELFLARRYLTKIASALIVISQYSTNNTGFFGSFALPSQMRINPACSANAYVPNNTTESPRITPTGNWNFTANTNRVEAMLILTSASTAVSTAVRITNFIADAEIYPA